MNDVRWFPVLFALVIALGYFGMIMWSKFKLLLVTQHRSRFFTELPERFANVMTYAFGQKKMFKEKKAGFMHAFIFWGFCVLQLRTIYLIVCAFIPDATIPGIHFYYAFAKDITELIVIMACSYALYRRLVLKVGRLTLSAEANLILYMLLLLMTSDFLVDGFAFALAQQTTGFENALFFDWSALGDLSMRQAEIQHHMTYAPVGAFFSHLFSSWHPAALMAGQEISYWVHIGTVLVLLNMLPGSKHFHVITAIPNVFFADLKHIGALEKIEDIEHQERFGVSDPREFTWKQVLDTYTCTECGRCEVNCPTVATGKALSPKLLITNIRDHFYAREKELTTQGDRDLMGWAISGHPNTLTEDVSEDAIWDCTTCRACSEACPVMIDHVDKIVDLRRNLVLMEAKFPNELAQTFKHLESRSNPWGLPTKDRSLWAEGLDIPLLEDTPDAEYVFWVGCAGAYDDRQKKVSISLVKLLRAAGIQFAILGNDEGCTGDPARRAGNEYLFQTLAETNIEMMKAHGVDKRKIVTHCPHCYNTIKNEYPQFGGYFEIVHHSVLLEELINAGKLKPKQTPDNAETVTYHDPCYLGRYNKIYEEPRRTIAAIPGLELKEMARNRSTAMCCGAGGAKVWMEEDRGTRINHKRVEQALETESKTLAVACPYCHLMLADGLNDKGSNMKVKDIAELVWESLEISS